MMGDSSSFIFYIKKAAFFLSVGTLFVSCSNNVDLEIDLGSSHAFLIPNKKTQSCYEAYVEANSIVDVPVYDIESKYFELKKPTLKWNRTDSDLEILLFRFDPDSGNSCGYSGNKILDQNELSLVFSKQVLSTDSYRSYKPTTILYGTQTSAYGTCTTKYTSLRGASSTVVATLEDYCPTKSITGDTCTLKLGGINTVDGVGACLMTGTLRVYGIRKDNSGNEIPVEASISVQVENLF